MNKSFVSFLKRGFFVFSFAFLFLMGNRLKANAYQDFFQKTNVTDISLNSTYGGSFFDSNQQTWYRFRSNPGVDYWYSVDLKTTGPHCIVYDEDGAVLTELNGMDWYRESQLKLESSKNYYIQMCKDYGSYTVSVNCTSDESDDQVRATAFSGEYSGELRTDKDVDWLSFNSGCNTATTVTAKHISGSSMEIQVFNADGTKVDGSFYINGYGKKSQTVLLDSNTTYYVKVCASVYNSAYYGKYKISVSGRQDEPGKRKDGQKIKCKKTLNGTLDANGDIDWYKIKLNKNRKWRVSS